MNRELLRKALRLQICRQCFGAFVQYVQPGYLMGWVHERICAELDRFLADVVAKKSPRLMLTMPPRHGKLCADDTDVLTADGWKKHGSLVPGDFVYGVDGRPVRVLAVGEPDFATHRVTMTDGSFVDVHLDHEWTFRDRGRNRTRTVETREVLESSLWLGERGRRGGRARWQLPLHGPVAGTERDLPLPPYVLGVWLGDGTSTKPYITMSPQDMPIVKQSFAELGYHPSAEFLHKQTGVPTVAYSTGHAGVRGEFAHALCDLGVLGNKHIPEQYKTASVSQRLELLAGLIDTDGHVDATGRVRFSTIFPRLAEDVSELASSFGVRVGMYSVEPETSSSGVVGRHRVYVLSFNSFPGIPVRLDRKKPKKTPVQRRIAVASVEALPVPVPGRCIQVDAEDGLYLVTRRFIPTHNSTLASRCFPAYALGRYPDMSIIAASYSADLASRMNRDVQRIMEDEPYAELFPATKLARIGERGAVRTSDIFEVVGHKGVYRSAGVGGGLTGMGCQIAVLDDVIKDRASADSPTVLQSVWDWYTSTLYTRLAPGGGIIIMNTRWSMQDLSGRLLEAQAKGEGDEWRVVNFPAIAEEDEEFRKKGEALHPERYPLDQLLKTKQAIGTRDWEALYQQHPVPDGGAIFKDEWLQRTWLPKDLPARFDAVIMSWDLSFKGNDASDFVVGQLVGRHGADYYILDQLRGRWSFTETVAQVKELAERARVRFPRVAPRILIEDKANGPAVIDALKHEVSGIVPVEPDGSKEARAHAVTALFEAGNVLLPDRSLAPWVDEYRLELTRFPSGAHDDQCFIAGTLVATPFGERPIESIKVGDSVITPFGCRKVLWSGSTGTAEVCTRFGISATLRHPFVCKNGLIIPFADIDGGEQCSKMSLSEMATWRYRKLLCSMVSSTDVWVDAETITLVSQRAMLDERELKDFMLRCGSFIRDRQFLKAMKFTTRTAILLITTTVTLSACRALTIARRLSKILRKTDGTLKRFEMSLMRGTEARKGGRGTENTHEQSSWSQRLRLFASAVARCFLPKRKVQNSALAPARQKISIVDMSERRSGFANGAGESLKQLLRMAEMVPAHVVEPAASVSPMQKGRRVETVYNLTVEDCHLFYANGFLVHNCDATTQALRYLSAGHRLNIAPALQRQLQGFRFRR